MAQFVGSALFAYVPQNGLSANFDNEACFIREVPITSIKLLRNMLHSL